MDKNGLTIEELYLLLSYWQKQLLLDDWNISIEIVEFTRTDYKQSGDIKVYPENNKAVILLTNDPFKDEEYVLVHELVHLLLWDFDTFSEKIVLEKTKIILESEHGEYMEKLESTVDHLTRIFIETKKGNV